MEMHKLVLEIHRPNFELYFGIIICNMQGTLMGKTCSFAAQPPSGKQLTFQCPKQYNSKRKCFWIIKS